MPREDDVSIYTDALALKGALEELLGREEWYRLKDTRTVSAWKSSFLRALKVSNTAIKATIEIADKDQLEQLRLIIEEGERNVRSASSILDAFSAFAAAYLRLSFQQLGEMPRRKGKENVTRATKSHWTLTTYRSVQYVQSDKQALWLTYRQDVRPPSEKALDPKYRRLRGSS